MNRVQTVTQKHYRVEKPGQKPSQVHEHQNWPSWHAQVRTGGPRHAHGRARAVVSWPGPGRVVARDRSYRGLRSAVSQAQQPYRGRVTRAPLAVSWALAALCVVIQLVSCKAQVTIHFSVLRYTSPAAISFNHDTVSVL